MNAQLRTVDLLGSRSEQHPFVVAAREAETLIRGQLNSEVAVAIRGLQVDIELGADREKSLAAKWNAARERMSHLAEARAEYANLVSSVQNHTRLVEAARKNLADARARQAGAHSASLITRIDGVEAGVRPDGPLAKQSPRPLASADCCWVLDSSSCLQTSPLTCRHQRGDWYAGRQRRTAMSTSTQNSPSVRGR